MIVGSLDLRQTRFLIAEIGNNHEGDASHAQELIVAAAEAGADAVKFQVIDPERLVHYSQRERVEQLSRFGLTQDEWHGLAEAAHERDVLFMASAFDFGSLARIAPLCAALKIASGDLDFAPLIARAAGSGLPTFVSTGAADLDDVRTAVGAFEAGLSTGSALAERLALLHCVAAYPSEPAECNLRAIETLASAFPGIAIGWSDHTLGIEVALMAAALGARIVEKHFTLDKSRSTFRDHALSSDPHELAQLARAMHVLDAALGDGDKRAAACEDGARVALRRQIVAARDLAAGHVLRLDDLEFVRPAGGLSPARAVDLLGGCLATDIARHEAILPSHVETGIKNEAAAPAHVNGIIA